MHRLLFIVFLSGLVTINMSLANAEITSAKVSVVGMACPFCAYGVEKKLKKVEGVGSIIINMQEGTAAMSAKNGASINVDQVPGAIRDSGFTSGEISMTATGRIMSDETERLVFKVEGSKEDFFLEDLQPGMKKQVLKYAEAGALVEVSGAINEAFGGTWSLSVDVIKDVLK